MLGEGLQPSKARLTPPIPKTTYSENGHPKRGMFHFQEVQQEVRGISFDLFDPPGDSRRRSLQIFVWLLEGGLQSLPGRKPAHQLSPSRNQQPALPCIVPASAQDHPFVVASVEVLSPPSAAAPPRVSGRRPLAGAEGQREVLRGGGGGPDGR